MTTHQLNEEVEDLTEATWSVSDITAFANQVKKHLDAGNPKKAADSITGLLGSTSQMMLAVLGRGTKSVRHVSKAVLVVQKEGDNLKGSF